MRARKNVSSLTPTERARFAEAVIWLHGEPSQRGLNNRYDDFARVHVDSMNLPQNVTSWGHGGPAFTAWHRVLLLKFEEELRRFDDSIRIPYWDWTVDQSHTGAPWYANFLGGDGAPTGDVFAGQVSTGPFAFAAGDWTITTGDPNTNDDSPPRQYLARGFGRWEDELPNGDRVKVVLPSPPIQTDVMESDDYPDFRFGLEVDLHNTVHRWVNGQMMNMASPMDPVFWLHHCVLDRLWAIWMRGRPDAERYEAPASQGWPTYHRRGNPMRFHHTTGPLALPAPFSGTYRPEETLADHAYGVWYEGDPPVITLETPTVSFIDVEDGSTTYAAIVFKVEALEPVSFVLTSAVPSPFGLPADLHPPAPVLPGDDAQTGRVWLSFQASGVGPVTPITVSLECVQTGEPYQVVVTANVVQQRTAAVTFVADRSGSMGQDAGNGLTKREKLTQAFGVVAALARDGDELALVTFDHQVEVPVPLGAADAAGAGGTRDLITQEVAGSALDPRGSTGIGAGIEAGVVELGNATTNHAALVVITDGVENELPLIDDVDHLITSTTYAIGIGRPTDVNEDALFEICSDTDGFLLVTGDLAGEELFRLHKYFLQIHAGVVNDQIVTDPAGDLTIGDEHRVPFVLSAADRSADVIVLCPLPDVLDVRLEGPDGTVVDGSGALPTVQPFIGGWAAGLRVQLPVAPGVQAAGTWTAVLSIDRRKLSGRKEIGGQVGDALARGAVPYSLVVSSRSDLRLRARARVGGDKANVSALLDAFGIPFWGRAKVWAEIVDPNGRTDRVALEGRGDGRYELDLELLDRGLHTIRVMAVGELEGHRFTREQILSIATTSGRPAPGQPEPGRRRERVKDPSPQPSRRRLAPLVQARALALPIVEAKEPTPAEQDQHATLTAHAMHAGFGHFPSRADLEAFARSQHPAPVRKARKAVARKATPAKKAVAKKASPAKKPAKRTNPGHGH